MLHLTSPVGDVRPLLHQGGDHSAQSQQRLVDVSCLASPLVHCTRTPDVFAAGKVHLEEGSRQDSVELQVTSARQHHNTCKPLV